MKTKMKYDEEKSRGTKRRGHEEEGDKAAGLGVRDRGVHLPGRLVSEHSEYGQHATHGVTTHEYRHLPPSWLHGIHNFLQSTPAHVLGTDSMFASYLWTSVLQSEQPMAVSLLHAVCLLDTACGASSCQHC